MMQHPIKCIIKGASFALIEAFEHEMVMHWFICNNLKVNSEISRHEMKITRYGECY